MPAKLTPLTTAEQTVAEQHLNLVFRFLRTQRLPIDDWFDVVIFRYLLAVQNWFNRPDLHRYQFSTIAWRNMYSAVSNEREKQSRRIETISLDAPIPGTDGLTLGDVITDDHRLYSAVQEQRAAPSDCNTWDGLA